MCNTPKYAKLEERTGKCVTCFLSCFGMRTTDLCLRVIVGYGGGFNERENVEYIEREESDGEYDEVSTRRRVNGTAAVH